MTHGKVFVFMDPNSFPRELEKIVLCTEITDRILILAVTPNLELRFPHCIINLSFSQLLQSRWPHKFHVQNFDVFTHTLSSIRNVEKEGNVIFNKQKIFHSSSSKVLKTNAKTTAKDLVKEFEESGFWSKSTWRSSESFAEVDTDPRGLLEQYHHLFCSIEALLTSYKTIVDHA